MTRRFLTRFALIGLVAAAAVAVGAGTASARGFHYHTGGATKAGGHGSTCAPHRYHCGPGSGPMKASPGTTTQPQIQSIDGIAAGSRIRF